MVRRVFALVAIGCALLIKPDDGPALAQFAQRPDLQGISSQAQAQIAALLSEKASRTGNQRKISSQLVLARRIARREAIASGLSSMFVNLPRVSGNRVVVDVNATITPSLRQWIRQVGIRVVSEDAIARSMRLDLTLDQIESLAAFSEVSSIQPKHEAMTNRMLASSAAPPAARPRTRQIDRVALRAAIMRAVAAQGPGTNVGIRQSEGDAAHKADVARSTWGFDGTGVKIGVLSDGVRGLASAQASGDLGSVTVHGNPEPCSSGSCAEGTAMLEIVHDIAPGAQLFFASAFESITSFASNIRTLRDTYGCDIIIDDVFYFIESPFQDGQASGISSFGGVVAQAVKDVAASGALYLSSAGNAGNLDSGTSGTWEGDFSDGGAVTSPEPGRIHNFGGQNYNQLTSGRSYLNLYWSDPLGQSGNDYDLFVLHSTGSSVIGFSDSVQNGFQDPYEQIRAADFGFSTFPTDSRVVIIKYSGSARFLHLGTFGGRLSIATVGQTHGHAATSATNSFGVAATPAVFPGPSPNPFNASNTVETFSSDGPRRIFFNADGSAITPGNVSSSGGTVLQKPDLTAADGVAVTGSGGFGSPFYGTSAAAPHAGAIAALIKSANLSLTAAQVRSALLGSAIDIHGAGVDRNSGVGIVMADTGVSAVIGPLMAIESPASGASVLQPFTLSGWGIDRNAATGTGVDAVHVYATPSGGSAQAVGVASYGAPRSDIATLYGSRFTNSGFSLSISGLAPGAYTFTAYARSTATGTFNQARSIVATITVPASQPLMALDVPTDESSVGSNFTITGWAVDRAAPSGAGVDYVHAYAYPIAAYNGGVTGGAIFLRQINVGNARSDIAAVLGSQFTNCGFSGSVSTLSPGVYRIYVYAHSTVTGTFNNYSTPVDITVGTSASDPVMYIDQPQSGTVLSATQPFTVAGWSLDRGASSGSGIFDVHVQAFPVLPGPPFFVWSTSSQAGSLGVARSDIANFYGSQFVNSGYNMTVPAGRLPAGTYDLYVFSFCTLVGAGQPCQARITRVTLQ